jgi:hypothetical protein
MAGAERRWNAWAVVDHVVTHSHRSLGSLREVREEHHDHEGLLQQEPAISSRVSERGFASVIHWRPDV